MTTNIKDRVLLGFTETVIACKVNLSTKKNNRIALTHSGTRIILTLQDDANPDAVWCSWKPITHDPLPPGVQLQMEPVINHHHPRVLNIMCYFQAEARSTIHFDLWALNDPGSKKPFPVDPQLILEPDGGTDWKT